MKKLLYFLIATVLIIVVFNYTKPKNNDSLNVTNNDNEQNDIINNDIDNLIDNEQKTEEDNINDNTYLNSEESIPANNDNIEKFIYNDLGMRIQSLVNLNIRELPTANSEKIGLLTKYEYVKYIERYNEYWYKIFYNDEIAYVSSNIAYSKIVDINVIINNQKIIDNVIDVGISLLAIPYEYGAQRIFMWNGEINPYFTGNTFDCSSFVQYIYYEGAGIKLNSTSRTQSLQGKNIDFNDMQRGDIIVMTSTARQYNTGIERIGHVAIYLGNNKILHTFGTGGVRIQDYSDFWKGRFIMARRIIY